MRRLAVVGIVIGVTAVGASLDTAPARVRRSVESSDSSGVPYLDVRGSCSDAEKFSNNDDKKLAYNGCLQDEMSAKTELGKRWSSFKGKDRSTCVEQARFPSPSYVEVLTCLEMSSGTFHNAPRFDGQPTPQVGGTVAPGLSKPLPGAPAPAQ